MQPRYSSPSNQAQRESSAYRLAETDRDFLLGNSMRGVRLQLEYQKVEERLRAWGVRSTVVVFGGARIRPDGPPQHRQWYEQARNFARIVSQRGSAICAMNNPRDNVIATGGGPGLMEAANRGAMEAGAPSICFNIALIHEQQPNSYTTPELTFLFQYFAIRKLHLAMRANALVIFPGGFGTLDEMFEILTLKQTKKTSAIPIILFDESFWRRVVNFDQLVLEGTTREEDLALFCFASTPENAWEHLERHIAGGGAPCHAERL
jgi:uncharacterized protein (TIGR00730 family)